jgi:hypothetical protein
VDQKRSQVSVATFGNAEQPLPVAARMLPWHKTQPCRNMPTVLELRAITDGCDDGRRRFWAYAPDPRYSLAGFILPKDAFNFPIEPLYTGVELAKHVEELFQDRCEEFAKPITLGVEQVRYLAPSPCDGEPEGQAPIQKQAAHLRDESRAMIDQPLPTSVESLDILLRQTLCWYEAHVRLLHRPANGLGIVAVILLMLSKWLHVLRRDDPDRVSKRFELPLPVEGSRAGLDANGTGC